jgi:hypothetical protein
VNCAICGKPVPRDDLIVCEGISPCWYEYERRRRCVNPAPATDSATVRRSGWQALAEWCFPGREGH